MYEGISIPASCLLIAEKEVELISELTETTRSGRSTSIRRAPGDEDATVGDLKKAYSQICSRGNLLPMWPSDNTYKENTVNFVRTGPQREVLNGTAVHESEDMALTALNTALRQGRITEMLNCAFDSPTSSANDWVCHYRAAEAFSSKLPALLDRGLQSSASSQPSRLDGSTCPGSKTSFYWRLRPLHFCAALGLNGLVRIYLEMGHDPNSLVHPGGQTALHLAVERNHVGTVRLLLEQGADVARRSPETRQPVLCEAAEHGHLEIVRLLLKAGADVHARDRNGQTALELATTGGHLSTSTILLGAMLGRLDLQSNQRPVSCCHGCCNCGQGPLVQHYTSTNHGVACYESPNCVDCGDHDCGHESEEEWVEI